MAPADEDLLFELLMGRAPDEQRQGIRIHADGLAEVRGSDLPRIDGSGRVQMDAVPLRWREAWRYTDEELRRAREMIAQSARRLEPRYAVEQGRRATGDRLTWRLRDGDQVVEVEVDGAPFATPPALEELYPRLQRLHERPVERTVWRVWTDERLVERRVDCAVGTVPVLRTLRNVLFNPDSLAPEDAPAAAGDPPAGTPLVEVEFHDGDKHYVSRFYADGRRHEERPDGDRELTTMSAQHLAAIRAAISSSAFARLPEPVC